MFGIGPLVGWALKMKEEPLVPLIGENKEENGEIVKHSNALEDFYTKDPEGFRYFMRKVFSNVFSDGPRSKPCPCSRQEGDKPSPWDFLVYSPSTFSLDVHDKKASKKIHRENKR